MCSLLKNKEYVFTEHSFNFSPGIEKKILDCPLKILGKYKYVYCVKEKKNSTSKGLFSILTENFKSIRNSF